MNENRMPSHYDLGELLLLLVEGEIKEEQFKELKKRLHDDPKTRDYYYEFLTTYIGFGSYGHSGISLKSTDTADEYGVALSKMAEEEMVAPCVQIEKPVDSAAVSVTDAGHQKVVRKIDRTSLITAIVSIAALILLLLSARYLPAPSGIEVATLTDSMKARWDTASDSKEKGARLVTGYTPLSLREGIVELLFDNNAKVIIEAPAEFCLLTEDQIKLNYGKLYAVVPQKAIGFSVNTPNSRVIDLGTEFGVQVGENEATELHVIKGKINLLAGTTNKAAIEVLQGYAKRILGTSATVNDIPVKETEFIRYINSKSNLVWRGEKQSLDLADMMGGGNGFGTGRPDVWLELATGNEGTKLILDAQQLQAQTEKNIEIIEKRSTDNRYHTVSHLSYVDGVFSPDGGAGTVQVSSKGHVWKESPDTSGIYFEDIFNGSYITTSRPHRLILNGQAYGTKERPAIALHSNAAITFNLESIRQDMPGFEIVHFRAVCGVSEEAGKGVNKEDFWVLIDGQKRFEAKGLQSGSGSREISIPLNSQDRFLTLISTDGDLAPNFDWGFFALPQLEIESSK